jgi:hypothetical protein
MPAPVNRDWNAKNLDTDQHESIRMKIMGCFICLFRVHPRLKPLIFQSRLTSFLQEQEGLHVRARLRHR